MPARPAAARRRPARGVVNALVVFIDFEDEIDDTANVNWPRGAGPIGIGPGFMGSFIDQTPEQRSGRKFNLTTFYRDMSYGALSIVGYPIYRRARRTLVAYESDTTTKNNVPYWATREVLASLTAQDVGGWQRFDSITRVGPYNQAPGPDGIIDLVLVCFRGRYDRGIDKHGWPGEGFAHLGLSPAGDYFIAGGTLKVRNGAGGSGVTWQNGLNYPDCWAPFHEVGHKLLGGTERYADDNLGLWTPMGTRHVSVSFCMNSFEREQLGWISFTDVSDGMVVDLPDFATTGTAYRMYYPGADEYLAFFFENHQRLNSPYITSTEDGVFSYDVVDKRQLPTGGVPSQRGLYVIENDGFKMRPVCADGRWDWECTGRMANPFNPFDTTAIFDQLAVNRTTGLTDRRALRGTYLGRPYASVIWVWRDENTGLPTWLATNSRHDGDGDDASRADASNLFTPWSNPAARFTYNPQIVTGAVRVIADNPDGTVRVGFHTTRLDTLPPSVPQYFRAGAVMGFDGVERPRVSWAANEEPNVVAGGSVEVWRQLQPYGQTAGEWERIATLGPSVTTHVDEGIGEALAGGGGNVARYRLRVVDSNGRVSNTTAERALNYGANPQKVARDAEGATGNASGATGNASGATDDGAAAGVRVWRDAEGVIVRCERSAWITVRLYDMLGREVGASIAGAAVERACPAGTHAFPLKTSHLVRGRYLVAVSADGIPAASGMLVVAP